MTWPPNQGQDKSPWPWLDPRTNAWNPSSSWVSPRSGHTIMPVLRTKSNQSLNLLQSLTTESHQAQDLKSHQSLPWKSNLEKLHPTLPKTLYKSCILFSLLMLFTLEEVTLLNEVCCAVWHYHQTGDQVWHFHRSRAEQGCNTCTRETLPIWTELLHLHQKTFPLGQSVTPLLERAAKFTVTSWYSLAQDCQDTFLSHLRSLQILVTLENVIPRKLHHRSTLAGLSCSLPMSSNSLEDTVG